MGIGLRSRSLPRLYGSTPSKQATFLGGIRREVPGPVEPGAQAYRAVAVASHQVWRPIMVMITPGTRVIHMVSLRMPTATS